MGMRQPREVTGRTQAGLRRQCRVGPGERGAQMHVPTGGRSNRPWKWRVKMRRNPEWWPHFLLKLMAEPVTEKGKLGRGTGFLGRAGWGVRLDEVTQGEMMEGPRTASQEANIYKLCV